MTPAGTGPGRRAVLAGLGSAALARPALVQAAAATTLRFIPQIDLAFLDPHWSTANITRNHGHMVFDTLYGCDTHYTPSPQMLAGHDVAADGRLWRLTLRPGLRWHDGAPVLARDCVASIRRWAKRDPFGGTLMNPPDLIGNGFQADGYVLEPGSEAERVLALAHEQVFGAPMAERRSTAVNDTRFYGLYHHMPALCYGPLGENHHGFDERGHIETLRRTTLAIAAFTADWCGVRPGGLA